MKNSTAAFAKYRNIQKDLATYVAAALDAELLKTKEVPTYDSSGEPILDTGEQPVTATVPATSISEIAYKAGIREDELNAILKQGMLTFPQALTILSGFVDPETTIEISFGA